MVYANCGGEIYVEKILDTSNSNAVTIHRGDNH